MITENQCFKSLVKKRGVTCNNNSNVHATNFDLLVTKRYTSTYIYKANRTESIDELDTMGAGF